MNIVEAYNKGDAEFMDCLNSDESPSYEKLIEWIDSLPKEKSLRDMDWLLLVIRVLTDQMKKGQWLEQKQLAMHMGVPFEVVPVLELRVEEKLNEVAANVLYDNLWEMYDEG